MSKNMSPLKTMRDVLYITALFVLLLYLVNGNLNKTCSKELFLSHSFNQTKNDLIIVIYIQTNSPNKEVYNSLLDNIKSGYWKEFEDFNIHTLLYYYDPSCNIIFTDLPQMSNFKISERVEHAESKGCLYKH